MATKQMNTGEMATKKHLKSLREYLDVLKDLGELQESVTDASPRNG